MTDRISLQAPETVVIPHQYACDGKILSSDHTKDNNPITLYGNTEVNKIVMKAPEFSKHPVSPVHSQRARFSYFAKQTRTFATFLILSMNMQEKRRNAVET